jgi:hypothetical protein
MGIGPKEKPEISGLSNLEKTQIKAEESQL